MNIDELMGALDTCIVDAEHAAQSKQRLAGTMRELATYVREQDKRFAEHLAAWKANNEWHAKRIAELEAQLAAKPEIDRKRLTDRLVEIMVRCLHYQEKGEPRFKDGGEAAWVCDWGGLPTTLVERYRNDVKFHAQVQRAVALILVEIPK